jgi:hypothetical protein
LASCLPKKGKFLSNSLDARERYINFKSSLFRPVLAAAEPKGDISIRHQGRMSRSRSKTPRERLESEAYHELHRQILQRYGWRCETCGSMKQFRFIT